MTGHKHLAIERQFALVSDADALLWGTWRAMGQKQEEWMGMSGKQNLPAWAQEPYDIALNALAGVVAKTGITPDMLTLISLLPALGAGIAAAQGAFVWAVLLMLLSGLFDILDGALARLTGQVTRFGALLDSTLDRLSDAAVPIGLVVVYAPHGPAVLVPALAVLSGYTVSYVRARAEGLRYELPRLWLRREDRMAAMVLALVLAPVGLPGIALPAPLTFLVFAALAAAGFLAAAHALVAARRLG